MIPAKTSIGDGSRPSYFRLRTALCYCAPMIVNGIALPFFPVWLTALHFSDREIGIIIAVPMVVRVLVAPLITMIADRMEERSYVLAWSGSLSLLTAISLYWTSDFWPVLLVYTMQGITYVSYVPVVESIAISGVRRWGLDYGSMRVWGSVAFIFSTLIGAELIGAWGGPMVLPLMVGAFVITIVMAILCPRIGPTRRRNQPLVIEAPVGSALRDPQLLTTMIGVSIQQASHAALYTFATIYWHQIGLSATEIGVIWSVGVAAEVMVFFLSKRLNRRFSAWTLIRIGSVVCIARWIIFPTNFGFSGYLALQCLHAFSFAFVHTGIQRRIMATVQERQEASAQGIYYFYNGMCLGLMTIASGYLYAWMGVGSFYIMAGVAAFGLVLVMVATNLNPRAANVGAKASDLC